MALTGMKYVNPDSVLARTAWEMVQTHAGGLGPHAGMTVCPVCGEPLPCAAGRAAAEVLAAAGLAESSGLIETVREGRGGPDRDPASPLGLPGTAAPAAAAPHRQTGYAGPQSAAPVFTPPADVLPAPVYSVSPPALPQSAVASAAVPPPAVASAA